MDKTVYDDYLVGALQGLLAAAKQDGGGFTWENLLNAPVYTDRLVELSFQIADKMYATRCKR